MICFCRSFDLYGIRESPVEFLGGGFRYFFCVHPGSLGKLIPTLTSIFFEWVGSTTN